MQKAEKKETRSGETPLETPVDTAHYIVGIGTSAGGLDAINELFDNIPHDTNFSYIVIQHLSPDHKSLMNELLAKHTKMKIFIAEEGMLVAPNCVYLIPAKKVLTIRHNKLHLDNKESGSIPNYAIDNFFKSLAKDKESKAIGIILSGTGTDGTKGTLAIKEQGGMTMVQDPATAKFDGMPKSAIYSGTVDFILPPEMMGEKLMQYPKESKIFEHSNMISKDQERTASLILELVREVTTNDFSSYKQQTIIRRIIRRMTEQKIDHLNEYLHFLRNNPDEVQTLSNEFLIGVTHFFRDPVAFQLIEEEVIPKIFSAKAPDTQVKIWVAACSTGEEAYSLAILFREYMEKYSIDVNVKLFATDMNAKAIEFAAKGSYASHIADDITAERLHKYFDKEGDRYVIGKDIRKMVIFAQHNLLKDPPFSKLDMVSCRNMLIYMRPELQQKALSAFHFSLKLGGFLFLGSSESGHPLVNSFTTISKKWNIYQTTSINKHFIMGNAQLEQKQIGDVKQAPDTEPSASSFQRKTGEIFNDAVLEEFGYAAFFINEHYNFLQALGDYKRFLIFPDKKLEINILKMLPKQLSIALGVALRKASRSNEKLVSRGISVRYDNETRIVDLIVKPYLNSGQYAEKFLFVLLKEQSFTTRKNTDADDDEAFHHQVSISRFTELEAELKETKQHLQSTIEELESSNEEMQSSNEELISANEELQSTNEELHTVNAEHEMKIRELSELNDDLNNYFRSTEIGQLFIDKNLLIRKYTPAVAKQINIIDSDIGRPISHFSLNIKYSGLIDDIMHVLKTRASVVEEIELQNGQFYQMRVLPYTRQDQTIDGVVITFVDITSIKDLNNMLSGVLESSLSGIVAYSSVRDKAGDIIDFKWILSSDAAENILHRKKGELIGKHLLNVLPGMKKVGLFDHYVRVAETGKIFHEELYYNHDGIDAWLEIVAVRIKNGIAVTFANITDKKKADEELLATYEEVKRTKERLIKLNNELEKRVEERTHKLAESEERFRLVSLATNDAIWDWNLVTNEFWWNEAYKEIFGYKEEDIPPGVESWFSRIHAEDRKRITDEVFSVINNGKKKWVGEYRFNHASGSYIFVYNRAYILHDENGIPYRMLGSLVDMTNLKKIQEELKKSNNDLIKINTDLDNFVYTASHDLKSPIANLEGLIGLLKQQTGEDADPKQKRVIEMLGNSVTKLNNTVKALTEITKAQKDADETSEVLYFQNILEDVKSDIKKMIEQNDVIIEADFRLSEMHYTKIHLRSIFYNMLSNAIKYRHPERQPVIHIRSEKLENQVCLSFKDNGLGMSENQINKLFTMFKRFHTHVEGTGIGLYMVKRMIENRGGSIKVSSKEMEGTTFEVYLKE